MTAADLATALRAALDEGRLPPAFARLLDVDWAGLRGNHVGTPAELPGLLVDAASADEALATEASTEAGERLFHQGELSPATVAAVPFLAAFVTAPGPLEEPRAELGGCLAAIAESAALGRDERDAACLAALRRELPGLVAALPAASARVREGLLPCVATLARPDEFERLAAPYFTPAERDARQAAALLRTDASTEALLALLDPATSDHTRTAAAVKLHARAATLPPDVHPRLDALTTLTRLGLLRHATGLGPDVVPERLPTLAVRQGALVHAQRAGVLVVGLDDGRILRLHSPPFAIDPGTRLEVGDPGEGGVRLVAVGGRSVARLLRFDAEGRYLGELG